MIYKRRFLFATSVFAYTLICWISMISKVGSKERSDAGWDFESPFSHELGEDIVPHSYENLRDLAKILVFWQFVDMERGPFSQFAADYDIFGAFQGNYQKWQRQSSLLEITQANLDVAGKTCEMRIIIINGTFWLHPQSRKSLPIKSNWLIHFANLLDRIRSKGLDIPDIEFLITTPDRPLCKGPAFTYSRRRSKTDSLLFLIPYVTWGKKNLDSQSKAIAEANTLYGPWTQKLDKVFWRGSSTGIREESEIKTKVLRQMKLTDKSESDVRERVWQNITRYRLLLMGQEHPEHFNVSLSSIYAETPIWIRSQLEPFVKGQGNNIDDAAKYKFVLDVEGNSFSDRLRDLLALESVLLKQEYLFVDFIGMSCQPWVHYIPVKQDLSDLISKLEALKRNGKDFNQALTEWTKIRVKWAQRYIFASDDLPVLYTYHLLKLYHARQDFTVHLPANAKPILIK